MRKMTCAAVAISLGMLPGCARLDHLGRAPTFSDTRETPEHFAMLSPGLPVETARGRGMPEPSLWDGGQASLFGDRRAVKRGDILTVVIEIDESAEISNSTNRGRNGSESLAVPQLLGLPQRLSEDLPPGFTLDNAVNLNSASSSGGDGSVFKFLMVLIWKVQLRGIQRGSDGVPRVDGGAGLPGIACGQTSGLL